MTETFHGILTDAVTLQVNASAPQTHVLTETQEEVKRGWDGDEGDRGSLKFVFLAPRL